MKKTGVKATEAEVKECQELAANAARTPVMYFSGMRTDMATSAWERCSKRCHELALAHGLPEIQGWYGMDLDGEFVLLD